MKIVHFAIPGPPGSGGVNYIRWGNASCPDTEGTETLYSGRAAGSLWTEQGGGSNYLCLPDEPEFLATVPGVQDYRRARVYGTEYKIDSGSPLESLHNNNAPCAACYTLARADKIMIPGKVTCPTSWTREYFGYLVAERHGHYRNSFECLDVNAEAVPGEAAETNSALFYLTEVFCNGIDCPPYAEGNELSCVVCTK